jgi:spore coat protein JC
MWTYTKKLEYPINIKNTNPKLASFIISQYGGPDGEIRCSFTLPFSEVCNARSNF